jgi:polysaccharide biosynthesis/export protein
MNGVWRNLVLTVIGSMLSLGTAGCAGSGGSPVASPGAEKFFNAPSDAAGMQDYRIGRLDKINITVFQVDELTQKDVQVDSSGRILLPLIGSAEAAGRTTSELSAEIATRLSERYLQNPQVSVTVSESVSQQVTVEGSVVQSGVYEIRGQTTLIQAIAMARGTDRVASLDDVVIFRRINGERMAAVFNLDAIRRGKADDPEIKGNDVVVVGISNLKAGFREVIGALPAAAIFYNVLTDNRTN